MDWKIDKPSQTASNLNTVQTTSLLCQVPNRIVYAAGAKTAKTSGWPLTNKLIIRTLSSRIRGRSVSILTVLRAGRPEFYFRRFFLLATAFRPDLMWSVWNTSVRLDSWDSSVGIVTRLRDGRRGFDSWQGKKLYFLPPLSDRLWGPYSLLTNG
jgi:hypothetical protein